MSSGENNSSLDIENDFQDGMLSQILKSAGVFINTSQNNYGVPNPKKISSKIQKLLWRDKRRKRNQTSSQSGEKKDATSVLLDEIEHAWNSSNDIFFRSLVPFSTAMEISRDRSGANVTWDAEKKVPSISQGSDGSFCGPLGKDTLAKIFLSIDELQPAVLTCLLQKISELADPNAQATMETSFTTTHSQSLPLLCLSQLRFIDYLVRGPELAEQLVSIISLLSADEHSSNVDDKNRVSLRRELISSLPEILDDESHVVAMRHLADLIQNDCPEIASAIMDAVATLYNANDQSHHDQELDEMKNILANVIERALQSVASVETSQLPLLIKFLTSTAPDHYYTRIIHTFRDNIINQSLDPTNAKLSLDALQTIIRNRANLAKIVFEILRKGEIYKPFDFWLFISLLGCPLKQAPTKSLFLRKCKNHLFSPEILEQALAPLGKAVVDIASKVVELSSKLIREDDKVVQQMAETLYLCVYNYSSDALVQRNVLSSIHEHICGGKPKETDSALGILLRIVNGPCASIFSGQSAYVNNLLDMLDRFSPKQIRDIFNIVGATHLNSKKLGGKFGDENGIDILLRKQLTHLNPYYRKIGIIASCTLIGLFGSNENDDAVVQRSVNILTLLLTHAKYSSDTEVFIYDYIENVVSSCKIAQKVAKVLLDFAEHEFEMRFIIQDESCTEFSSSQEKNLINFASDKDSTDDIERYISTFTLVSSADKFECLILSPLFKLIGTLQNLGLETKCDYFNIPLLVPHDKESLTSDDILEGAQVENNVAALFIGINLIRETINLQLSVETKEDSLFDSIEFMIPRVEALVKLENLLLQTIENQSNLSSVLRQRFGTLNLNGKNVHVGPKISKSESLMPRFRPLHSKIFIAFRWMAKKIQKETEQNMYSSHAMLFMLTEWLNRLKCVTTSEDQGENCSKVERERFNIDKEYLVASMYVIPYFLFISPQEKHLVSQDVDEERDMSGDLQLLCFECLQWIFSHKEFFGATAIEKLHQQLALCHDKGKSTSSPSKSFEILYKLTTKMVSNSSKLMFSILQVLEKLVLCLPKTVDTNYTLKIHNLSKQILEKTSGDGSFKPSDERKHLPKLIEIYVASSINISESLQELTYGVVGFLESESRETNEKDEEEKNFGMLTRGNAHIYLRTVMEQTLVQLRLSKDISVLETIVGMYAHQSELCKKSSKTFSYILRFGRNFVDIFSNQSLKVLAGCFTAHKVQVLRILRTSQKCTRSLQHVCSHVKAQRDKSLSAQVPALKRRMEVLLFRVKAILRQFNQFQAFDMGVLKHRNIDGEKVESSQLVKDIQEEDEEENFEEEIDIVNENDSDCDRDDDDDDNDKEENNSKDIEMENESDSESTLDKNQMKTDRENPEETENDDEVSENSDINDEDENSDEKNLAKHSKNIQRQKSRSDKRARSDVRLEKKRWSKIPIDENALNKRLKVETPQKYGKGVREKLEKSRRPKMQKIFVKNDNESSNTETEGGCEKEKMRPMGNEQNEESLVEKADENKFEMSDDEDGSKIENENDEFNEYIDSDAELFGSIDRIDESQHKRSVDGASFLS